MAIDGAAEKRPANRFGTAISPSKANSTTNNPPFTAFTAIVNASLMSPGKYRRGRRIQTADHG